MSNFKTMSKEHSMEHWTVTGENRLVKVVSPTSHKDVLKYGSVKGYVTQEKYLTGMNTQQIEIALGLRPFELRYICYIYSLQRLPKMNEVEFRYSCDLPDGKAFGEEQFEQAMAARDDFEQARNLYTRSQTPIVQYYQTGSSKIPQWELMQPIPVGLRIATVTRTIAFSNADGLIA